MVFCLHVLALQQSGDLSKAYPASRPVAAAVGSSHTTTLKKMHGSQLWS